VRHGYHRPAHQREDDPTQLPKKIDTAKTHTFQVRADDQCGDSAWLYIEITQYHPLARPYPRTCQSVTNTHPKANSCCDLWEEEGGREWRWDMQAQKVYA
jgi:hypothetical protein